LGGVREYKKRVDGYEAVTNYWSEVVIELVYMAEIDGNSNKTVTLKGNIQQNKRYHNL
jgi:hypothetical protein